MSSAELLAFSESHQLAIVGHALQQPKIWDILHDFGVDEKWLVSNTLADVWQQLHSFNQTYKRYPVSIDEISAFVIDDLLNKAVTKTLNECVRAKSRFPWDALEAKLIGWAKSRKIFTSTMEIAEKYNSGKHDEAYEVFQKTSAELQKIEAIAGLEPDGFVSAAERVKGEKERRNKEKDRIVPYAFPYLQDALGGILPTEVVLWSATSGAGKTEAAKIQAAFLAKQGMPVHYFALEAEIDEIERRIKFGLAGKTYKSDHPGTPPGFITYKNFRLSRLDEELSPYDARIEEMFARDYSNLHVYYKRRGDFGLNELEREITKLTNKSKLIVIDHIHFVDTSTDDENREMKELIKKLRSMATNSGVPILCVAHINKSGAKNQVLIPSKEDIHGSSDLFKIATTAIMIAPARGMVTSDSRAVGKPTFFRIVKARIDNGLDYYPGISFYDPWSATYTPFYSVGKLEKGDKKWSSIKGDIPYWVNIENNIVDISDIES
jgi:replicative DNA helicase